MKNIFWILLAVVVLACDNTFSDLDALNEPPVITFENGETTMLDSLKTGVSIKFTEVPLPIYLFLKDKENKLKGVSIGVSGSAGGTFIQDGTHEVSGNFIPASVSQNVSLTYKPQEKNGNIALTFTLTDKFDASSKATLNVFVFDNLAPVAKILVTKNQVDGPYSSVLDASASFDQDKSQGGEIKYYEFTVTGTNGAYPTIKSTTPTVPFPFPGPGGYTVSVLVRDQEGATATASTPVTF